MDRALYVFVALIGLAAAIANRRFAAASLDTSARHFGRPIREGTREHRLMVAFSRTLTVVCGSVMFVGGLLGAFGLVWDAS